MEGWLDVGQQEVLSAGRATRWRRGRFGGLWFPTGAVRYTATRFSDFSKRRQTTAFLCKMSQVLNVSDYSSLCGQPKPGHGWHVAHKPPT